MVKAPTPERGPPSLCRERKVLIVERRPARSIASGAAVSQGISGYEAATPRPRERWDMLHTGDGRLLPDHLKAQVRRELIV